MAVGPLDSGFVIHGGEFISNGGSGLALVPDLVRGTTFNLPPALMTILGTVLPNLKLDSAVMDDKFLSDRLLLTISKDGRTMHYLHPKDGVFPNEEFCALAVLFAG